MTLAEAVGTIKKYCENKECESCALGIDGSFYRLCGLMRRDPCHWQIPTETNIYDEEEIHENCTVQILRNSLTGEESVGWWENEVGK